MIKVPLFGLIYKKVAVTVDRSSPENRAESLKILKRILNRKISIFFFPEGTFNATSEPLKNFYDGAFRIAIETNTPIKPILFLDAYARLQPESIFTFNPGKSRSVFLKEIPVTGMSRDDVPKLKQHVYELMDAKLREYKASWIT